MIKHSLERKQSHQFIASLGIPVNPVYKKYWLVFLVQNISIKNATQNIL